MKKNKVRDHSHITGEYKGAAHNNCNLKLKLKPYKTPISVVFHNFKGYDSHLIMQNIAKVQGRISCIPNNTEKYISFSLGQLKFLDSFQFMASSLENLVKATDKSDFKITKSHFSEPKVHELLFRKGIYPLIALINLMKQNCRPLKGLQ